MDREMIIDPANQSFSENHKLMIGSIIPRPIALVSTISKGNINNVAPFSYFNGVCSNPPTIMFAPARRGYDGKTKDTLNNIRETNEFAINIVSEEIVEPMVACSTDYSDEVDEFKISDFTPIQCDKILAPRVEESKVVFECKLNTIIEIGPSKPGGGFVVIGEIVLFHINDDVFKDGKIDLSLLNPVGRLSGNKYSRVFDSFEVKRQIKPTK